MRLGERSACAAYSVAMTQKKLDSIAEAWIIYWHAPVGSSERRDHGWATDLYELEHNDPEALWLLILKIHHRDTSPAIQEVLSAGPIEELLARYGTDFIDRVEAEARNDPSFAKVLGGVWQNQMPADV